MLDEEDERILDKVWAEVARHPRMAVDPDAPIGNGESSNDWPKRHSRATMDGADVAENGPATAASAAAPAAKQ